MGRVNCLSPCLEEDAVKMAASKGECDLAGLGGFPPMQGNGWCLPRSSGRGYSLPMPALELTSLAQWVPATSWMG